MKRLMSLVLCLLMMINVFPVKAFAKEEQSLEEIIRPQVEAFAKSIDQKNADGKAQDILISHGIGGNGKKLSVGKSSALTATLINAEFMKVFLTDICVRLVEYAQNLQYDKLYCQGSANWNNTNKKYYDFRIFDLAETTYDKPIKSYGLSNYAGKINSYDNTLVWIAGDTIEYINIETKEKSTEKTVYNIDVVVYDRFDFDTNNETTLKNLLGFIGLLLFEPFDWESKFSFQIEIPIEKPDENEVFGDFDGSGNVDVADAYFARLVAAKLVEPTPEQLALCDVDRDGKITAIDANLIRKFAAGIIKSLPIN